MNIQQLNQKVNSSYIGVMYHRLNCPEIYHLSPERVLLISNHCNLGFCHHDIKNAQILKRDKEHLSRIMYIFNTRKKVRFMRCQSIFTEKPQFNVRLEINSISDFNTIEEIKQACVVLFGESLTNEYFHEMKVRNRKRLLRKPFTFIKRVLGFFKVKVM